MTSNKKLEIINTSTKLQLLLSEAIDEENLTLMEEIVIISYLTSLKKYEVALNHCNFKS